MAKSDAWRYYRRSDGRWYRKWREAGSRTIHQQLESRWTWEREHGPIPPGHEIHHRDLDHGLLILINSGRIDAEFAWPSNVTWTDGAPTRLFSSALEHDESDPDGRTPAGSLQVLRIGRAPEQA